MNCLTRKTLFSNGCSKERIVKQERKMDGECDMEYEERIPEETNEGQSRKHQIEKGTEVRFSPSTLP